MPTRTVTFTVTPSTGALVVSGVLVYGDTVTLNVANAEANWDVAQTYYITFKDPSALSGAALETVTATSGDITDDTIATTLDLTDDAFGTLLGTAKTADMSVDAKGIKTGDATTYGWTHTAELHAPVTVPE